MFEAQCTKKRITDNWFYYLAFGGFGKDNLAALFPHPLHRLRFGCPGRRIDRCYCLTLVQALPILIDDQNVYDSGGNGVRSPFGYCCWWWWWLMKMKMIVGIMVRVMVLVIRLNYSH